MRKRPPVEPLDSKVLKLLELQKEIHSRLVAKLDLAEIPPDKLGDEDLWQRAETAIVDLVETMESSGQIPAFIDQDTLIKESLNEALGLGPLEDLLADDAVETIIVDRADRIIVGKNGALLASGKAFSSDDALFKAVERLVAPTGRRIDVAHPIVDVRLRDGSRLAAAIPPVAVRSVCFTLTKPKRRSYNLAELIANGTLSPAMADFLTTCMSARRNVIVCGASGSGKSGVLAALVSAMPEGERIVSVEEVAELSLERDEWIALEARPGDSNGVSRIDLGTVLRGALRMAPDRLVVGDVRGGEALELIGAMASANDGTVAAVGGESPAAALARLTSMARLAAPDTSVAALRELVDCAVDVVVHVARYADGRVRVASIAELKGARANGYELLELFAFRGTASAGGFAAAGVIPDFYQDLEARGIPADTSIFR